MNREMFLLIEQLIDDKISAHARENDKNQSFCKIFHKQILENRNQIIELIKTNTIIAQHEPNFFNNQEKMKDFKILTKKDFLKSYSYITQIEYNNTLTLYKTL